MQLHTPASNLYIGLMSGTSLDGVDAALVAFARNGRCQLLAQHYMPFADELRTALLALNSVGANEIEHSALLANQLARHYAECIAKLLQQAGMDSSDINAIGMHGQTIRHRPELGYTVQIGNAALLAELSGIDVVSDFRSRDVAAGGQGAPLVPAFHRASFADEKHHRVIVNIGGISNLSDLAPDGTTGGFDCGPGNLLMDGWIQRHLGKVYDRDGAWAASGSVIRELLQALLAHPFFAQQPPKSTGRDTFHLEWLQKHLSPDMVAEDVQATLLELSARAIADAVEEHCSGAREIYLCGGGAHNLALHGRLQTLLEGRSVSKTDQLGIAADWVEAAAFAWLARQALLGQPGNLPAVTGAAGPRLLGAIYPA
jgi:anhydro-N-acetylmuramic acid kinase